MVPLTLVIDARDYVRDNYHPPAGVTVKQPVARVAAAHPPPRVDTAPADHAWNLAETIQSKAADAIIEQAEAPRDSDWRDDPGPANRPVNMSHAGV